MIADRLNMRTVILVLINIALGVFVVQRYSSSSIGVAERVGSCLLYPFLRIQQRMVRPLYQYWHERAVLQVWQARCHALQKAVDALEAEVIALRSTETFAVQTKELIEYQQRFTPAHQRLVGIMLVQRVHGAHYMWVDAGSVHGITTNMIVLYKNCLLGRIVKVYPYYSKVQLISDASCNIAVEGSQSKASGIYQGAGENAYAFVNHVNHLTEPVKDELMLSSGQGLVFPAGFAVGFVDSWELSGVYYRVKLRMACNVNEIKHCYIYSVTPINNATLAYIKS